MADTASEEWREIRDFPYYEVSSLGRVRRSILSPKSRGARPGRILKFGLDRKGYLFVNLWGVGADVGVPSPIHRLVGSAFVSGKSDGLVCAHRDGNKRNNSRANLVWVTQKVNLSHRREHGTHREGEQINFTKLTEKEVRDIKKNSTGEWGEMSRMARKYGVTPDAISLILRGKNWKHVHVE